MFIAIEGIDASGKATQSKLLADELHAKLFSFPDYSTPMGGLIKSHLHKQWYANLVVDGPGPEEEKSLDAMVFQSLQITNRLERLTDLVKALHEGPVVSDRYLASGLVYGKADGLDPDYLYMLQRHLPQPDLQILIDIDPEDSVRRRPERRDRYEQQAGYMEKVTLGYRELWKNSPKGDSWWVTVNGRGTIEEVFGRVMAIVREL